MLFALALPAASVGVAGAVELYEVSAAKAKLQAAADAAALSGAREMGIDRSAATAERAKTLATQIVAPLAGRWTVSPEAQLAADSRSLTLTLKGNRPSLFGNLLPPGGFQIAVTATAVTSGSAPLCVLGLDGGGKDIVSLKGSSALTANACLVQSNASMSVQGAAKIQAGAVRAVRSASGQIAPAPVTDAPPVADPFASLPINIPSGCDDFSISLFGGTRTLNPGTHCGGIQIGGTGTLILNPGEHYFTGGGLTLGGDLNISGTDVVLFIKGSSAAAFAGNSSLTLEGRKSGPYAGFVIIGDRSFTGKLDVSTKNAKKLLGTIYLPSATLQVSGAGNKVADQSSWTVVVAKEIDIQGSANLVINSDYQVGNVPVPAGVGPGQVRLKQ